MKSILKFSSYIFIAGVILVNSCKKDLSCENCGDKNKPPIANAGADQLTALPKDSVLLDGSSSNDPDGTITSYKWIKLSGPSSFSIINPDLSKTIATKLVAGVYQFELTITDNGGLSAKDTMQVMVDAPGNQPPVACAGADQTITLPPNSITINGSCSADPDNNITSYAWTKISGPSTFNIANANAVQTAVTNLIQGIYQFELKVIDAGGLFSKDTIQITVNATVVVYTCGDTNRLQINAKLIPIGTLSRARDGMAVASAGNQILFAGGYGSVGGLSRVDIYDIAAQSWSTAELSEGRYDIAAIATGNKIFFAGGEISDGTCATKTVDIYDVSNNTWAASFLSIPGNGIAPAVVGNKVLFGGGDAGFCGSWARGSTVDIYNLTTNTWSTALLGGIKRSGHAAVTINNKVYFSGGETWPANPVPGSWYSSNTIDIYDDATNSWSTSSLTEGKLGHAGVAINDRIFWAGGYTGANSSFTSSCIVEIRSVNTGSVSIQKLFQPGRRTAVVKNNKIIFYAGADKFDVYDVATDSWSIGVLPISLSRANIISVNNTIYLAGGVINGVLSNKVWKLEF